MLIGLLVLSAVVMLGTEASAQSFDGWGWFGFSEVTGVVDLRGVPNPDNHPTIVQVTVSLKGIQVICVNPNDKATPASPGNAGDRTVTLTDPITLANFTGDPGQARVTFHVDLSFAEVNTNCVNPNWTVIQGSAAVSVISVTMNSYRCTGKDADPCFDGTTLTATLRDTVSLACTLDPVLRDPVTLVPLHDQVFTCVQV